ncbi:hypothetical protein KC571_02635 [candidate division WWE3 bacterium]|uniref:Uncharacterized protein n=1 Tax=candidate division WWE3 bacterium TaxID=2053526 RepID=A0A955LGZ4_UNCKA|nr:hypothetical protein [candidate division WWE3 bacterium]
MDAVTLQAVGTRLLPGAQLLRTKQTFFSDLGIFSLNGSGCKVVKHLLPALANGHTDLPRLMTATQAFMTELNTLGITTPSTQLAQCNEGVFMISDFVGPDLQEYLSCQDNPTEIRRIFVKMIHLLRRALLENQE